MIISAQLVATASAFAIAAFSPVSTDPLAAYTKATSTETAPTTAASPTEEDVQLGPTTESVHVLGATAYATDGTELGEVTGVKIGDHGEMAEIHVAMALPLGLGEKTVAIPIARCITLRGAVIVEMPITELARLPAVGASK